MLTIEIDAKLEAYTNACRNGTDWILNHLNPDGSVGPVEERLFYYRVPWALALMGEVSAAHSLLDWIDKNMLTTDGRFEGISTQGGEDPRYGSYPLACLIFGSSLLGRIDLVRRGTEQLSTWQDPETGGFYATRSDRSEDAEQELFPTAQAGMSLALTGRVEAAIKAGEWFQRLWDLQPEPERRLYAVYSRSQGLVQNYPEEQEAFYVTKKDEPWQHHFNGGIAAAFLSQLHMASGSTQWLDLAREYQRFSMTGDECQFRSMQLCKSGWGSGLLYMATREEQFREWTIRLGDWFVDHQLPDGHWENTKFWSPDPTVGDNILITAEFVQHLCNIRAYLSVA